MDNQEPAYLETREVRIIRRYNPSYGDDRICVCGHSYYRHFDPYEDMDAVGCKYCQCAVFEEFDGDYKSAMHLLEQKNPAVFRQVMLDYGEHLDRKYLETAVLEHLYRMHVNAEHP